MKPAAGAALLALTAGGCTGAARAPPPPTPWPDTSDGVHAFLTFDSSVSPANVTAHASSYDYVWGASKSNVASYRASRQDIKLSMYIPYSRDPSCTAAHPPTDEELLASITRNGNPPPGPGPHKHGKLVPTNIKWWLANHPDWITYKCDKTTIAYEEGDCNVPLDISNPAVIAWQQSFVREAAASGYDAMACDNYQLESMGDACGVYSGGKWVQKWTGKEHDPQLAKDVVGWMRQFVKLAHTTKAQSGHPMLVIPNSCGIPTNDAVWQLPDAVLNEEGFTHAGHTIAIGEEEFVALVDYMVKIQAAGKAYYSLNEWGAQTNASGLDRAIRQWCVSTYLMGKNQASAVYISTTQGYGHLMPIQQWPELTAPVGQAMGAMAKQQGVYFRNYTKGLAIVNPTNVSATVDLDPSYDYTDCYRAKVTATRHVIQAQSGEVLLRKSKLAQQIASGRPLKADDDDGLWASALPSTVPASPLWHTLEFGANLGYTGGPCASAEIMRQAAADGVITRLRAMDPFPAGYEGTCTPSTAPAMSSGWMQKILDSHPSITLLVSLNTYPYKLPADFGENYEDYLPTVDWETVLAEMPASWNYSTYLSGMAEYTNRAPLFAAEGASVRDYASKLTQLRGNLSAAGLADRVVYEIGNEPNALLYFWGDASQFEEVADVPHALLNGTADDFYCCGYSSTGNGGPEAFKRTPATVAHGFTMEWYSAAFERYRPAKLSWHLYLDIGRSRPAEGYENSYDNLRWWARQFSDPQALNGSIISEWGLDSSGGPALLSALNGPRLVVELAKLLAFAFEFGVSEVYYESLADHPKKHELMGLFDKWGKPKLSYGYLREVILVIQGGYTVANSTELLQITGRSSNRTLYLAHDSGDAAMVLNQTREAVVATSAREYDGKRLLAGDWVVTCDQKYM